MGEVPGGAGPDGAYREPEEYLVAHIREALATDPRVGEQGLEVSVAGGRVFVHGTVATPERRDAVSAVLADWCDGRDCRNETVVARVAEPLGAEEL